MFLGGRRPRFRSTIGCSGRNMHPRCTSDAPRWSPGGKKVQLAAASPPRTRPIRPISPYPHAPLQQRFLCLPELLSFFPSSYHPLLSSKPNQPTSLNGCYYYQPHFVRSLILLTLFPCCLLPNLSIPYLSFRFHFIPLVLLSTIPLLFSLFSYPFVVVVVLVVPAPPL